MIPLFLTLVAIQTSPAPQVYSGRDGQLDVAIPRVESPAISIDARLSEPVWDQAAILGGFRLSGKELREDGFFVKLPYLFRM